MTVNKYEAYHVYQCNQKCHLFDSLKWDQYRNKKSNKTKEQHKK